MTDKKTQDSATLAEKKKESRKLDKELEASFPTSDPPSYMGGATGAPEERESTPASAETPAVKEAEKKVKDGKAPEPHTY